MKRIAVHVATTGGPVLVQRITPEFAAQSMICLGRTSEVLPISADYDDFVKPGSGVIMREFGPFEENAFRLDASGPIGTGRSWQLGVYAAHAIDHSEHCVLSSDEDADTILWMTGMVDYDLNVKAVDHIADKAQAAQDQMTTWLADGKRVFAVVPKGNNHKDLLSSRLPDGVEILPAGSVEHALAPLHLSQGSASGAQETQKAKTNRAGWAMFGVVAAAFAVIVYNLPDFASETPTPPPALEIKGDITLPAPEIAAEPKPEAEPEPEEEDFALEIFNEDGEDLVFNYGDHLEFAVEMNRNAWLNCFYFQADGKVLQLYPNPYVEEVFRFEAGETYDMPSEEFFPFQVRFAPPAGEEVIVCFASEENLTDELPEPLKGQTKGPLPATVANDIPRIFHSLAGDGLAVAELPFVIEP
ncbi:DUF4384 domain-containing protein [Magnetovibrio sp. PR-2]|uniref:DUF4384 domain-containing protein n=1 Tax=Magnetovibrio sp. PR-2 TaxID=3120356 RepID=UPI002FCDFFE2